MRFRAACFALLGLAAWSADAGPPAKGIVHPKVPCLKSPEHSYALYLPTGYGEHRSWPVLFAFSPNAQGETPVRLFRAAAERLGYILVGSNDSKNGLPLRSALEAQEALWQDVQARFKVDPRRSYATGFSGGSRMALRMALKHSKSFAGVISIGAFHADDMGLAGSGHFAFALLCGLEDFNYGEMLEARAELQKRQNLSWSDHYEGPHAWPPARVCSRALEFMQIASGRATWVPLDSGLEASFRSQQMESANAAESSGEKLLALRRWRNLVADFPGTLEAKAALAAETHLADDAEVRSEQALESRYRGIAAEIASMRTQSGYLSSLMKLRTVASEGGRESRFARQVLNSEAALHWEVGQAAIDRKDWKKAAEVFEALARFQDWEPWPCIAAACARSQQGEAARALDLLMEAR